MVFVGTIAVIVATEVIVIVLVVVLAFVVVLVVALALAFVDNRDENNRNVDEFDDLIHHFYFRPPLGTAFFKIVSQENLMI
ncbi:MAG: hypothetical protein EBQ92_00980 [Proteobacteria bacterium]|nr:hypothetical protein [Pseudomonadota bacterium]